MRIGFVVNDITTEQTGYTTTRLGMTAINMGHEAWVMGVADLAYDPDERIRARARMVPRKSYKSNDTYLRELKGAKARQERITVDDLDVVLLRNDPSDDAVKRPWATSAGIIFGRVATQKGTSGSAFDSCCHENRGDGPG